LLWTPTKWRIQPFISNFESLLSLKLLRGPNRTEELAEEEKEKDKENDEEKGERGRNEPNETGMKRRGRRGRRGRRKEHKTTKGRSSFLKRSKRKNGKFNNSYFE